MCKNRVVRWLKGNWRIAAVSLLWGIVAAVVAWAIGYNPVPAFLSWVALTYGFFATAVFLLRFFPRS